jgi:putative ABC transport system ATP-binding protein
LNLTSKEATVRGENVEQEKRMATQIVDVTPTAPMAPPQDCIIGTEELWKTYVMGTEQVHALRGVNLRINRGEYVAIMGPSGSGKSTLMNLIGCLDTPSKGRYWLNSNLVSELDDDELARIRNREIGFVFQTFNLLARATALHNVELPLIYSGTPSDERLARAKQALESVDLGERMNHKPNELSGGQRQRVAIARALVNHPVLLLADEPTGDLDERNAEGIFELMQRLHRTHHLTSIVATHNLSLARRADRVLALEHGKLVPGTERLAGTAADAARPAGGRGTSLGERG